MELSKSDGVLGDVLLITTCAALAECIQILKNRSQIWNLL